MNYGLDFLRERGFTQLATPIIAHEEYFTGTGYFPWMQEETFKAVDKEKEQHLIGSSEVTMCAYRAKETIDNTELPLKYTACTPCFRTEVGSYGKDTKGLYRLRQFTKVEQVVICEPEEEVAFELFDLLINNAKEFMQTLELPYRVMELCTAEIGAPQKYKQDIEAWMPSRNKYGETHSCSWLGDFQTRRLNIKTRNKEDKAVYCHL